MGAQDRPLITAQNRPAPQYFNEEANNYEVIKGRHGANSFIQLGTVAMESWEESASTIKTFPSNRFGFSAVNDGTEDMSFTIHGNTRKLKPGDSYSALFEPFTSVSIVATTPYRAEVLR